MSEYCDKGTQRTKGTGRDERAIPGREAKDNLSESEGFILPHGGFWHSRISGSVFIFR